VYIKKSEEKVTNAINRMKGNKSAGVDGYGTTFVKGSSKALLEFLGALMKGSLASAIV
jgi:hypothetical protein